MAKSPTITQSATLDILQANVELLAVKQRLEDERQQLLDAENERTEFIARISHDLRTPLSSIIGFSDLILTGEGAKLNRRQLDYIEAIHRNGHQLLALINDMLDLSTLEARRMKINRHDLQLVELLADLRAATEPVLIQAGLHVTWPSPQSLFTFTANIDRRRILQVLVNLVDNARKFTPRGGRVQVSFAANAQEVLLKVIDTGPGIPENERLGMFRPYAQRGSVPSHDGVGLGLAIVKAIVELHGGTIAMTDGEEHGEPTIGRGCTCTIRIPQNPLDLMPPADLPHHD